MENKIKERKKEKFDMDKLLKNFRRLSKAVIAHDKEFLKELAKH
jgi:hypothetical protein